MSATPATPGPQTAADWHRAVARPTPEMQAQQRRLQAALARARQQREARHG